ncbi:MAG: TonB-dependent receptor domain-containing protein [Bryobacteraceae bacterium]
MNFPRNSRCFSLIAATLLFFSFSHSLQAQVEGGTLSGTVKDSSGAVIAAATVVITNSETNVARTLAVNNDGFYSAPNLLPGTYQVTASGTGFKTVVRSGLTLTVGANLVIDMELPVGEISEKVQVTAEAPEVSQSSSSLDYTVNATTVRELPLNGRDWTLLATLQPGVTTVSQSPLSISNQRANRGLGTQLTVGGNRPQQNNYRLDGISINDYSNGGPGSILGVVLGVESIQEFSVLTNDAPAGYGRTAGGVINAMTRSGTNDLHGSAYEFLRNSALDARNFFDPRNVPPFRRNQFGADAGWHLIKDRTFIFGDYEGIRQGLGTTQPIVVPSPNARNGQLASGQTVVVDPKVRPYLALYPLPNGAITGDTGVFNLATQQTTREDFFTTRVDHRISSKDSLFGTYMFDDGNTTSPDSFNAKVVATFSRRQAAILEATHIFSPVLLNSLRFGFSRVVSDAPKTVSAINPLAADTSLGFLPGVPVGLINVTPLTNFAGGLGAVGEYAFHYNSLQLYDDAFLTKGTHAFKFGVSIERLRDNKIGKANPTGQFIFGSISDFLTNKPTSFNSPVGGVITPRGIRDTIVGLYFQDDWRVTSNLTVNLGLRYETASVPSEVNGKLSNLASLTDTVPRLGSPYFSNPTRLNFEPRVGFAWDPFRTGKTSVRGGFGIYDGLPLPYLFELTSILSAPFFVSGNIANPPQGSFPTGAFPLLNAQTLRYAYIDSHPPRNYVLQWNFNIQREIALNTTVLLGYAGSRGVHLPIYINDFDMVLPTATPQGYVWPSPAGSGTRLNPNVGQISGTLWNGDSTYHSLQAQVTRRLSKGLQGGVSYTWAKNIDSGSSALTSDTFANSTRRLFFDAKEGRGPADFDIRHNLTVNLIWQVPGPKSGPGVLRWAANGWQWGGIYHASTGIPFTPLIGGDPVGMKSQDAFDRPDRLTGSGCEGSLVNPGNQTHYIKTECFAFPSPVTRLGNAGRNIVTGPALSNLDTSLFKNNRITKISETFNVQFRAEFFNILNHANFAPPLRNLSLFSAGGSAISSAGLIDSTLTTSRQIQFGLKVIW